VRPRKPSAAICSRCHQSAPGYDQLPERSFEFIPLWGFFVFLLYAMRRVDCRPCGAVVVEEVPWGDGNRTLTRQGGVRDSCRGAGELGSMAREERNRGGGEARLGVGRPQPLLSRSGPASDRGRDTGRVVDLLTRVRSTKFCNGLISN
jgi:hypothetical protein